LQEEFEDTKGVIRI